MNITAEVEVEVDISDFPTKEIVKAILNEMASQSLSSSDIRKIKKALPPDEDWPEIENIRDERKRDIIAEYWDKYTPEQFEQRLK